MTISVADLLHFDGANESTEIVDATGNSSPTVHGNAAISTAESVFGGASLNCPNAGTFLTAGTSDWVDFNNAALDFGGNDFTVEFWVRAASTVNNGSGSSTPILLDHRSSGLSPYSGWLVSLQFLKLEFLASSGDGAWDVSLSDPVVLTAGTWHHVAVCRAGNTWYLLRDGTLVDAMTSTISIVPTGNATRIGNANGPDNNGVRGCPCYIDELCVTLGQAKYTGPYTVPAQPLAAFGFVSDYLAVVMWIIGLLKASVRVTNIVGGSIYRNLIPQGVALPAIRIDLISAKPTRFTTGERALTRAEIQIAGCTQGDDLQVGAALFAAIDAAVDQQICRNGTTLTAKMERGLLVDTSEAVDGERYNLFGARYRVIFYTPPSS